MELHPSIDIRKHPDFAVVTSNEEYGHGILSWHTDRQDALDNAEISGGKIIPVDYIDGKMIFPPYAETVLEAWFRDVSCNQEDDFDG